MARSNVLSLVAFAGLLFSGFASLVSPRQSCLLDTNGNVKCMFPKAVILPSISDRQACGSNEYGCSCVHAVQYNNEIRAKHDLGPLSIGSISMLDNAVQHSRSFVSGPFQHQILDKATADIKCGIFCSGENIAKFSGESDDPAKKCMDMWENSPGHLANILGASSMTVVGIYEQNGITYCTQTFGVWDQGGNAKSGSSCEPVTTNHTTGSPPAGPDSTSGDSFVSATPSTSSSSPPPSRLPHSTSLEASHQPFPSASPASGAAMAAEHGSSQSTTSSANITPCMH